MLNYFFLNNFFIKEKEKYFKNIWDFFSFKMTSSKLINYSADWIHHPLFYY
jgi:hypothetical protein